MQTRQKKKGVPIVAQQLTNPTRNHEIVGWIPGHGTVGQESRVAVSCGVGHRRCSDPELLWLCLRLVATAPIRPLAWEPPCATGVALEKAKKTNNDNNTDTIETVWEFLKELKIELPQVQ